MPDATNTLAGTGVMPSLTVNDIEKSTAFFTALGFEIEDRWEHEGKLLGVMLKAGDAHIGLSQDDGKKGMNREKGVGMRLYVEAASDIDAVAARAKAAGVALTKEPHDTEWGTRLRGHRAERVPADDQLAVDAQALTAADRPVGRRSRWWRWRPGYDWE